MKTAPRITVIKPNDRVVYEQFMKATVTMSANKDPLHLRIPTQRKQLNFRTADKETTLRSDIPPAAVTSLLEPGMVAAALDLSSPGKFGGLSGLAIAM